jgi:hypothetical protein
MEVCPAPITTLTCLSDCLLEDPYVYVAVKTKEEPKFLGGSWLVKSMDDLRKAEMLPGASAISELEDAPGGGREVRVPDPDGYVISLLYREENDHSLGFALEFPAPAKLVRYIANSQASKKLSRYLEIPPNVILELRA